MAKAVSVLFSLQVIESQAAFVNRQIRKYGRNVCLWITELLKFFLFRQKKRDVSFVSKAIPVAVSFPLNVELSMYNVKPTGYQEIINEMRHRAGPEPRKFDKRDQVRMGWWRKLFENVLAKQVNESQLLIQEGKIFWSALVQANNELFEPGGSNLPGVVVYSTSPQMDDQPEVLAECAKELFSFKGKEVDDPELKAFAKSLAI